LVRISMGRQGYLEIGTVRDGKRFSAGVRQQREEGPGKSIIWLICERWKGELLYNGQRLEQQRKFSIHVQQNRSQC
jgi:hypothetical protein